MKKISDLERIEITERALHVLLKDFDMFFKAERAVLKTRYESKPVLRIDGTVNPHWMGLLVEYFVVEYVYLDCNDKSCRSLIITTMRDLSKYNEIL